MPLLKAPLYSLPKLSKIKTTMFGLVEGLFLYCFIGTNNESTVAFGR